MSKRLSRWYIPSWNGDFRFVAEGQNTVLEVMDPTVHELAALNRLGDALLEKKIVDRWLPIEDEHDRSEGVFFKVRRVIRAPIETVAPLVVKGLRPSPSTLTVVSMGGKVSAVDGVPTTEDLSLILDNWEGTPPPAAKKKSKKDPAEDAPAATAATVGRPTPSCPDCIPGAIEPANEVLQAFLTPEQHEMWARSRSIVVVGGTTGHHYLVCHRNSPRAIQQTRICFDLTDNFVLHFHDIRVPPEEEVLATKLILEHREAWLRNEATCFGVPASRRLKNPFGDITDGMYDASLMDAFGRLLKGDRALEEIVAKAALASMEARARGANETEVFQAALAAVGGLPMSSTYGVAPLVG